MRGIKKYNICTVKFTKELTVMPFERTSVVEYACEIYIKYRALFWVKVKVKVNVYTCCTDEKYVSPAKHSEL